MIKCKAVADFTEFVEGVGQIHGDPNNTDEKVSHPEVPASRVAGLIERGKIEVIGDAADVPPPVSDGAPVENDAPAEFTMEYVPVGKYAISGPGLSEPEVVKGKKVAEARLAELFAAHEAADEDDAPAG